MTRAGIIAISVLIAVAACGGDGGDPDPLDVVLGETTLVIIVNPTINDVNEVAVPAPGVTLGEIEVSTDDGVAGETTDGGLVVLRDVSPGTRVISFDGLDASGSVTVTIGDGELREVAVAIDDAGASIMTEVVYELGGQVVELDPEMPSSALANALDQGNIIVFLGEGTYTEDLTFSGSDVTLFGAGAFGGRVTIDGGVTIEGSRNRIRGADVTGNVSVPGSDAALTFSRVEGNLQFEGSNGVLLQVQVCGDIDVGGSGATALGSAGLPPLPSGC
jgi:hypothetical protein